MSTDLQTAAKVAQEQLDAHARDIVKWHFSEETGCPFWLEWARKAGWNPARKSAASMTSSRLPSFPGRVAARSSARGVGAQEIQGRPFNIFETGGHHRHAQATHRVG
jgi:hypothetical protein